MKRNERMFAIKLYELEKQYGRMQSRLRLCQEEEDHEKILQQLQSMMDEFRENELLQAENAKSSRSRAVTALAGAQAAYYGAVREVMEQELPAYLHSEASTFSEDRVEAAALYAEYAIDCAVQSMRYALIAVLKALDLQMSLEEKKEGSRQGER